MTIDGAIEELTSRIDLWKHYRERGSDGGEPARIWRETMELAVAALKMQKRNVELKKDILEKLGRMPGGDQLSVAIVRELIESFKTIEVQGNDKGRGKKISPTLPS